MSRFGWIVRLAPLLLPVASIVSAVAGLSSRMGSSEFSFENFVFVIVTLAFFTGRLPLLLAIGLIFVRVDAKIDSASKRKIAFLISLFALAAIDGYRIGQGLYF